MFNSKRIGFLGLVIVLCLSLLVFCKDESGNDNDTELLYGLVLASSGGGSGAGTNCTAPTFDQSAADTSAGQTSYSANCASCHGASGEGSGLNPALTSCSKCSDFTVLAEYIHCNMPSGNTTACQDDCARNIAEYIMQTF